MSARKPVVPIDLSTLGPKMRGLPNDRWRAAAVARFLVKPGVGGNTAACRAAGFSPSDTKRTAYRIFHDRRMLEALHELGEQHLKNGVPDAIGVVQEILRDQTAPPRDRLKAAAMFIDREHRLETTHHVVVESTVRFDSKELAEKLQKISLRFNLDPQKVLAKSPVIDGECQEIEE
jgi:hypothetical protein